VDACFDETSDQQLVFSVVGPPLTEAATTGLHGCLLAYGQSGSGKTHTMVGDAEGLDAPADAADDGLGVIPRLVRELFARIAVETQSSKTAFRVTAQYVEIYKERIFDLLKGGPQASAVASGSFDMVRDNVKVRDNGKIEGTAEPVVTSVESVMALLKKGSAQRVSASTSKNDRSSRSHAIFRLRVTKETMSEGSTEATAMTSTLTLVDLAGSERYVDCADYGRDRLREMTSINLSLTTLRRVIQCISRGKAGGLPPLRESLLTRTLTESFGGNSCTAMIITVSPEVKYRDDTMGSLRFGGVVRTVVNTAQVNFEPSTRLLRSMSFEIDALKSRLLEHRAEPERIAELEGQLGETTARYQATLAQIDDHARSLREVMLAIAQRDENIAARDAEIRDVRQTLSQGIDGYLQRHADLPSLAKKLRAPLKQKVGCANCQNYQSQNFILVQQRIHVDAELGATRERLDEARAAVVHVKERGAVFVADMILMHQKLHELEVKDEDTASALASREAQVAKYVGEVAALTTENFLLKRRLELADAQREAVAASGGDDGSDADSADLTDARSD
jgi:hypothetical protein